MIKIKAELWPFGDDTHPEVIGEIDIMNDGDSDSPEYGNYDVAFHSQHSTDWVRVERYYRRNGYLGLLRLALNELHAGNYERN